VSAATLAGAASAAPVFENLGEPFVERELSIGMVTPRAQGGYIAWGQRKRTSVVGVDLQDGHTFELDISRYGRTNIQMAPAADGSLVYYAGSPGRFFRYTTAGETVDIGAPFDNASYTLQGFVGPDERFYVGTYPEAALVVCDLRTWKAHSYGRISDDVAQKYITTVIVADDGTIYCSVGLEHHEVWSVVPGDGSRRQILPKELTTAQGAPRLWLGADGQVYGRGAGNRDFRCRPDGVDLDQTAEARPLAGRRQAGEWTVGSIGNDGVLTLTAEGREPRRLQTDYSGRALEVYSVGCERGGRIYGGTVFPGRAFAYDIAKGAFADLPEVTPKVIQIYDLFSHAKGLFAASYMGCILDFFDPEAPVVAGTNPRRFKASISGQERPVQWEAGPDGCLYFGTTPAKGRLGGALVRVDPETFAVTTWPKILTDQSINYLCRVPQTRELFGTGSVSGGTSAIPTQKEADCFLWDVAGEKVVWQGRPLPGTTTYLRAVPAANGLIVGVAAGGGWFLFDPVTRETVHRGELPVSGLRFPCLSDLSPATNGLVIGVGESAVFAIDTEARTTKVLARHDSLRGGMGGFLLSADGTLYYGSATALWRCRGLDFSR